MDLEFNIDFDSEDIKILINNSVTLSASKDTDGEIIYKRFERLDSEELQEQLKKVVKILFAIEEV